MARSLSEIYALSVKTRDEYLGMTEIHNDSKMSIVDVLSWVSSACIWAFENMLDVFKVDLAKDLNNRVNGTPAYFVNALLKYQSGDKLVVSDDGTSFHYANIDESKRIIKRVSYSEQEDPGFNDRLLVLKIAGKEGDKYMQISPDEMIEVRAYIDQILFAGQHALVVSRKGDVLIPRVTVYYDGAVTEKELYTNIEESLSEFINSLHFDAKIYTQKIIDCIQRVEHVTDVWIDESVGNQGIFVAQYNDDNHLISTEKGVEQEVGRYFVPNSGYIKQSTKQGEESDLPTWREAIVLKLEDRK